MGDKDGDAGEQKDEDGAEGPLAELVEDGGVGGLGSAAEGVVGVEGEIHGGDDDGVWKEREDGGAGIAERWHKVECDGGVEGGGDDLGVGDPEHPVADVGGAVLQRGGDEGLGAEGKAPVEDDGEERARADCERGNGEEGDEVAHLEREAALDVKVAWKKIPRDVERLDEDEEDDPGGAKGALVGRVAEAMSDEEKGGDECEEERVGERVERREGCEIFGPEGHWRDGTDGDGV